MEKKKKNSRQMLLSLITIEQNNLVLFSLLKEKDFSTFCLRIKEGYELNAFVLICIMDNGFGKNLETVLELCCRYNNDIYDFFVLYLGKKEAEKILSKPKFFALMQEKFDDDTLINNQMWEIIAAKKRYDLLIKHNQIDLLHAAFLKDQENVVDALSKEACYDLLFEWECFDALKASAQGRLKLWNEKKWNSVLEFTDFQLLSVSGFDHLNKVYAYILENGGIDILYSYSRKTKQFLLDRRLTEPFVQKKDWSTLYQEKLYAFIDVEEWWNTEALFSSVRPDIIKCAVKQKKWNFLEDKECLWALFRNFRWWRWYRAFASKM